MEGYILVLGALIVIMLTGCAQEEIPEKETPETIPTEEEVEEVNIAIRSFSFNPDSVTVKVGTTVIWINEDSVVHTVTSDDGVFDSGTFGKGQTYRYTFNEAGTYRYTCTIHPSMKGEIIVTE
jgi:plastocyanin